MSNVRNRRDDATPLQKKPGYYRRPSKDNPYDLLTEWQKEAFELLYTRYEHNLSASEIATRVGKSKTVVSEFHNSPEYEEIAALRSYRDLKGMLPLAIATRKSIMTTSESDVARLNAANKVIEEVGPLMDKSNGLNAKTVNIFQTIVQDGEGITLEAIRKRRIETQRRLELGLESTGSRKTR